MGALVVHTSFHKHTSYLTSTAGVRDCRSIHFTTNVLTLGVFTSENSHRREFHTGMTFLFRIVFTL